MFYNNWRNTPVLSEQWFRLWQKPLLFILNCVPVMGRDLRQALGIPDSYDKALFTEIHEHCFHCYVGNNKLIAVIYSRTPLADSLRRNYSDLWKLFHSWDMNIANKYCPAFNVGFDSYFPQTGGGGSNTTCDGYAQSTASDISTAFSGNNLYYDVSSIYMWVSCAFSGGNYTIRRSYLSFNTNIGSDKTITQAKIGITKQQSSFSWSDSNSVVWIERCYGISNPGSLASSDFTSLQSYDPVFSAYPAYYTTSQVWTDPFSASAINKTGISQFSICLGGDNGSTTPSGDNSIVFKTADGINDPCLSLTYSLPAKGLQMMV